MSPEEIAAAQEKLLEMSIPVPANSIPGPVPPNKSLPNAPGPPPSTLGSSVGDSASEPPPSVLGSGAGDGISGPPPSVLGSGVGNNTSGPPPSPSALHCSVGDSASGTPPSTLGSDVGNSASGPLPSMLGSGVGESAPGPHPSSTSCADSSEGGTQPSVPIPLDKSHLSGLDIGDITRGPPPSDHVSLLEEEWPEAELPEWIQKFYKVFQPTMGWDKQWSECFKLYLKFEHKLGYEEHCGKLPEAKLRPPQISEWFKAKRRPHKMMKVWTPDIGSAWREQWWKYWYAIQPQERIWNGELVRPDSLDWEHLQGKGGVDGLLLVMLTLLWWGNDTHSKNFRKDYPENFEDWRTAVDDVWYVLDSIIAHGVQKPKGASKRKHVEVEPEEGEPSQNGGHSTRLRSARVVKN